MSLLGQRRIPQRKRWASMSTDGDQSRRPSPVPAEARQSPERQSWDKRGREWTRQPYHKRRESPGRKKRVTLQPNKTTDVRLKTNKDPSECRQDRLKKQLGDAEYSSYYSYSSEEEAEKKMPEKGSEIPLDSLEMSDESAGQPRSQEDKGGEDLGIHALTLEQIREEADLTKAQMKKLLKLGVISGPMVEEEAPEVNELVTWGIDSCAATTVIPKDMAKGFPLYVDGLAGRFFKAASGHRIQDEGAKILTGSFALGPKRGIAARVCDTKRPLMAVGELTEGGAGVLFSKGGSFIMDEATATAAVAAVKKMRTPLVKLTKRGGTFECDMTLTKCNFVEQKKLAEKKGFPIPESVFH